MMLDVSISRADHKHYDKLLLCIRNRLIRSESKNIINPCYYQSLCCIVQAGINLKLWLCTSSEKYVGE
jgi:hypothetical protein